MNTQSHCLPCIFNQLLRVADYLQLDENTKMTIMHRALARATEIPFQTITAPEFSEQLYQIAAAVSGVADPYKQLRHEQNHLILDHIDQFRNVIRHAPDPLQAATFYALLGNLIDYGGVQLFATDEIFNQSPVKDITHNDYPLFKQRLENARSILILSDNAGEAVFDRLFIEEIKAFNPRIRVYYGVRSYPAINDIIREDAEYIGINHVAAIIESGSSCAGTIMAKAPADFKKIYQAADLIVSKGQGNFETLENEPENIFFIFKVKCEMVALHTGLPLGGLILAFKNSFIR